MHTRRQVLGLAVLVAALTPAGVALAQTQPSTGAEASGGALGGPGSQPSPARSTSIWYGYQTLACDVASVGLFTAGVLVTNASESPVVGLSIGSAGGFVYMLGGPIVHLAHGRDAIAVVDVVIRAALPFASLFVGALIGLKAGWQVGSYNGGELFGGSLGVATAMAIDAAAFAQDPQPAPAENAQHGPSVSITPTVRVVRETGGPTRPVVGVAGRF